MPSSSHSSILARASRAAALAALLMGLATSPVPAFAQAETVARVADAERIHALVIGIDAYRHVQRLRGAVADARDIETSLRAVGVTDVTVLLDGAADRDSILAAIESLRARVRPGDLVVLSIAGHGAQEPEHVKGSATDGRNEVFLLAGFDTAQSATTQRILDMEFRHIIKSFEAAGARVLFVADTCSGGGLARDVDPRAREMIYRAVPTYKITDDELKPVATPADAFTTELDLERTIFLAAADRNTKAPEIEVEGIEGYRGALSYAVARALRGAADTDKDGTIVVKELFDYVHDLTYQLSDQRQNIVSVSAPDVAREPIVRSVTIVGSLHLDPDLPAPTPASAQDPSNVVPAAPEATVRIAVLDGDAGKLAGLKPIETRFEVVPLSGKADLIWDPRTGDVISGGDIVARKATPSDLPSIIDRTAAVRSLKQAATKSIQAIRLVPDSRLHHQGSRIEVVVDELAGRALLLFNIAGDGTVQLLYPTGREPKTMDSAQFQLGVQVREPFGSDQIVAVTAARPQADLEQALVRSSDRRAAVQLVKRLVRTDDPSLKVGSIGVFTAP